MRWVRLGDLISPSGRRAGTAHNLPVYSVTKHAGFVPSEHYFQKRIFSEDTSDYKVVDAGEFAYATIHLDEGSIGIAPEVAVVSPMYTVFSVDSEMICNAYLLRLLKSPLMMARYKTIGRGAVHRRKSISIVALSALKVPIPTINEQRHIVAVLDEVDARIAVRRKQTESLAELSRTTYREMFDSVPAECRLEDLAECRKDAIRTGPFGSQLLKSEYVDDGVPVLGLENVVSNEFRWSAGRCITAEKYAQLKRYTVRPHDVLISIMGTVGRCVVVPEGIPLMVNTKHICAITLDRSRVEPEFVRATFLYSSAARRHLARETKGAIMAGLNMGIIRGVPMPMSPMVRQREYVQRIKTIRAQIDLVERALALDEELLASLQSRAFRGAL